MAIASIGENPRPQLVAAANWRVLLTDAPQYGQLEMASLKSKPNRNEFEYDLNWLSKVLTVPMKAIGPPIKHSSVAKNC